MSSPPHTPDGVLSHLRSRGATRLRRVTFRRNRSTIWSLTQGGSSLNLHVGFRAAPDDVLDALALLAREGGRGGAEVARARETVRGWEGLERALRSVQAEAAARRNGGEGPRGVVRCAGTPEQGRWLREAYQSLDARRFGGRLPDEMALRFSRRMRSSLGHMRPGAGPDSAPRVVEIALNLDLLLEGNEAWLVDTLLHEMAHAAAWLFHGERGHGAPWRRWARSAGCAPRTRHEGGFLRRTPRSAPVHRVPPPVGELVEGG